MRKIIIQVGILLILSAVLQVFPQEKPDEKLFLEAKILVFDKEWESAQKRLEELIEKYPKSSFVSQAYFYRAKCLQEQGGKELEALNTYKDYLKRRDRGQSLVEESERSIIDLAADLYKYGKRNYLEEIEDRLSSPNKVIKYYAAFKLSYMKDKKVASKGVSILKEILRKERDNELRDRAKIALLRVHPDALKDFEEEKYDSKMWVLNVRFYKMGEKEPYFKLTIPWALADLALGAISEEEKAMMKAEGHDLSRIIEELKEVGEFVYQDKDEGVTIRIWIEKK